MHPLERESIVPFEYRHRAAFVELLIRTKAHICILLCVEEIQKVPVVVFSPKANCVVHGFVIVNGEGVSPSESPCVPEWISRAE